MISATIETRAAIEKLRIWRNRLRMRLRENVTEGARNLLALVRTKLSGDVLRTGSGALHASLCADVGEKLDGFVARVWSDGSVPYARIQEYGGRITVPAAEAGDAKALAFAYGGKMVFAKRVTAHIAEIPERSYMRSSLAEFAPAFADGIRKLTVETAQ